MKKTPVTPKICLAASGGGHLTQLLNLSDAWVGHDHFFVSDDTGLSRSLADRHRTYFVPHFALGQARLTSTTKMLSAGLKNFLRAVSIVHRERPDIVITTGAGTVYFPVLLSRIFGAKVILIESITRSSDLSLFARLSARLSHLKIVQSEGLRRFWPDAMVFDPLRVAEGPAPEKRPLVFTTVGATLPFDRLVRMAEDLKTRGQIPEELRIQRGADGYAPEGLDSFEAAPFEQMLSIFRDADIVVTHGGAGTLITALRESCKVIVVPRLYENGEVYDSHQLGIARTFSDRGLIKVANTAEELAVALDEVRRRPRLTVVSDHSALVAHIGGVIGDWWSRKARASGREEEPVRPGAASHRVNS